MPLLLITALFAQILTPDESKAVEETIASLLKAGFPEGDKATVCFGTLSVLAVFDPEKEPSPLPSGASTMQMSAGGGRMKYGYEFGGMHVKLADGTWLVSLSYRFKPREGDVVKEAEAPAVDLATLTETAAKAHPFNAEKDAADWIARLAPEHRARAAQSMNMLVPVTYHLKLNADALPPTILM